MIIGRIKSLIFCFFGGILAVVVLFYVSGWVELHPRGFLRKLPSHEIVGTGFIQLSNIGNYFAGTNNSYCYIASWSKRSILIGVKIKSKEINPIKINGFDSVKFDLGASLLTDSSILYLLDGNKPVIMTGDATTGQLLQRHEVPYFTAAVPLSANSYVLKVVEKGPRNAIVKVSDGKVSKPFLLEQQGDGIFSTDGMLIKSARSARIFYISYYRNQFLCLDTNLNLLYKGKTIDTVSQAHIKVSMVKSQNELTLSSPPLFVNLKSACNDKYLFIQSGLRADNEVDAVMEKASVIDVYRIVDGQYVFSFYIGDFDNEKMRDFRVVGNTLVAMFDDYLYKYDLKF